jgi:hypothetical protein
MVAVFTYQMEHFENDVIFCLAVDQGDPKSYFLARFRDTGKIRRVLPKSQCTSGEEVEREGVKEIVTSKSAVVLGMFTDSIVWKNAAAVEVPATYYSSGLSAAKYIYTVSKKGNRWVVVGERLKWIS